MKDLRNVAEPGYYSEEELLREAGLVFEEAPGKRLLAKTEPSRRFGCQRQHVIVTVGLLFLSIGSIAVLWSFHPLGRVSFDNRTAGRSERVNQVPSKLEPDVPQISRPYLALREMRAKAPSFLANIARIAKATNATNVTKAANVTNGTNVSKVTPLPAWNSSSTVKTMPSLFCFTLMIPGTAEQGLLETAAQLKTSLFACDDHAIFSNVPGKVWGTQISVLWNVNLWCDKQPTPKWAGGAGSHGPWSAANTRVFQIVWAAVLADVRWKKHDWIVKTDADTVFLPSSLRGALIHNSFVRGWYNPAGSYLGNCAMGLYGGLEVLSRQAAYVLSERRKECPWVPQEDAWLKTCFKRLNVQKVDAYGAFCFRGCDQGMEMAQKSKGAYVPAGMCPNQFTECIGPRAAFHAFKTIEQYRACFYRATSTAG